jgi:hypothetical protein
MATVARLFGMRRLGQATARGGGSCPRRFQIDVDQVPLVDPGRPVAEERGEQAKQENEQDKTNSHTGTIPSSRWTVRAPGVLTKYDSGT